VDTKAVAPHFLRRLQRKHPLVRSGKLTVTARTSRTVANIPVAWDAAGDFETNLEQIITQKWLALYPDSPEAWAERRRTGYPVGYSIILSLNPDISENELFRRMTFVDRERSDNTAATSAAEALLNGPDANTTRIWWDAKPLGDFPPIP